MRRREHSHQFAPIAVAPLSVPMGADPTSILLRCTTCPALSNQVVEGRFTLDQVLGGDLAPLTGAALAAIAATGPGDDTLAGLP